MLEWEGRTGVPVWSVVQAFGNQRYLSLDPLQDCAYYLYLLFLSFWDRSPTDREFVAQALTGLIHGARGELRFQANFACIVLNRRPLGLVPWIAPTTDDISSVSPKLGIALRLITGFILNRDAIFSKISSYNALGIPSVIAYNSDGLQHTTESDANQPLPHTGLWRLDGSMTLVLASNLEDKKVSFGVQIGANKTELNMLIDIGVLQHTIGDGQIWITLESLGSIAFIVLH